LNTNQSTESPAPNKETTAVDPGRDVWPAWPTWKSLDNLGNVYFLRVSYVVLVGVPLVAVIQERAVQELFKGVPLTLRLGYLSSVLLSVAHMLYQAFCPQVVRRFDSPNDLYRDMLAIKALQHQYLPTDTGFTFDISHCRDGFDRANRARPFARLCCGVLYCVGLALFAWLVIERSLLVFGIRPYAIA
jgi:hypothetical protein